MSSTPTFTNKRALLIAGAIVVIGGVLLMLPLILDTDPSDAYPLVGGETVSAWKFASATSEKGPTQKEIVRLKGLIGHAEISDYDLYTGIASEYELLGDGKTAYHYYSKAIALEPNRGIAYYNLGHLLEKLGALTSAQAAYAKAAAAEPSVSVYQDALAQFASRHPGLAK